MLAWFLLAVSVADFGAIPNDGQNDSVAIQRAVDTVSHVEFPAGTYDVDMVRIQQHGVTLEGRPGAVLRKIDNGQPWMLLLDRGYHGLTVRGLEVDGNEANQPRTAYSACLRTTQSDRIRVDQCVFRNGGDRAIDIRAGKVIWITDSEFYDCGIANPDSNGGNAISVDRHGNEFAEDVIISGNHFDHFGDTAIGVPACKNVVVVGNVIIGNPQGGIDTESGISFNGSLNGTCTGNVIRDCRAGGIFLWDRTGQPIQDIAVAGNTLVNSQISCRFMLQDSQGVTITGNSLTDGQIGVMGDGGSGLVISGNNLHGLGIRMTGRGHAGHVITGNAIRAERPIEIQAFVQPGLVQGNVERTSAPQLEVIR